jgi:hypothetical protein
MGSDVRLSTGRVLCVYGGQQGGMEVVRSYRAMPTKKTACSKFGVPLEINK